MRRAVWTLATSALLCSTACNKEQPNAQPKAKVAARPLPSPVTSAELIAMAPRCAAATAVDVRTTHEEDQKPSLADQTRIMRYMFYAAVYSTPDNKVPAVGQLDKDLAVQADAMRNVDPKKVMRTDWMHLLKECETKFGFKPRPIVLPADKFEALNVCASLTALVGGSLQGERDSLSNPMKLDAIVKEDGERFATQLELESPATGSDEDARRSAYKGLRQALALGPSDQVIEVCEREFS